MNVAFVTDSGTGRSVAKLKELGIYSLPLQISDGTNNFMELEDISIQEVYERISQQEMLKTSLPSLGMIDDVFAQIKKDGYDTIFAVPICSGLSGTMNAMRLSAAQNDLTFESLDTYVTAEVEYYCITKAKELYENGMDLDTIKQELGKVVQSAGTLLIPVDLDHLKRGGRLTPVAATLAGLLKIKPILTIDQSTSGKIDVLEKVRTLHKAMDKAIDTMIDHHVDDSYKIFVACVLEKKDCQLMAEKIQSKIMNSHVELIDLVSCVGCHTGIGCIAIQYYKEI